MSIVADKLIAVAGRFPDKPVFVHWKDDGFQRISYRLFLEAAGEVARRVGERRPPAGGRVVLLADYGPKWCAAYMGIHLAGLTVVPLDAQYSEAEVKNIVGFVSPVAIFTDNAHRPVVPGGRFELVDIEDVYDFQATGSGTSFSPVPLPEGAPMSIIFTSGTTGDPKGVMLSPENFMSNVTGLQQCRGLVSERDVALSILPLHHVYGFTCTFLGPVLIGCTIVFPRSIAGPDITEALKETGITLLVAVPQLLTLFHKKIYDAAAGGPIVRRWLFRLLRRVTRFCRRYLWVNPGRVLFRPVHRSFPALRYIASGGARLEPDVFNDLRDVGLSIVEAYGLTETSPIACLNNPRRPVAGSVGKPMAGVSIRIDMPEGGFDQGEVCIRGGNVMMGYFGRRAETEKAVVDGWFHSGDLGYVDARGNLFLTGRKKEVIVLPNGKNIYPEELEKIYTCSDRIGEVCVLPLGEKGREKLAAAVYPNMEYFKRMKAGSMYQDIKYDIETAAGRLPSYQRVTRIEIIDRELPRTRLGKLKRFKIREMIESREKSRDDSGPEEKRTEDPFLRFVMSETGIGFVPQPDHNLETDVGLDSLAKLELFSAVEKTYGVQITSDQAGQIVTVAHLREVIGDAAAGVSEDRFDLLAEMKRIPEVPMEKQVDVGAGIVGGSLRCFSHAIIFLFLKLFMGARITGREHLPKEGPFIIAGNHVSYFDALMIYGMFPYRVTRRMFSLSIPEIFGRFPLNVLRRPGRIIMTGTHDTMVSSMQYSYTALKGGAPMCIFPEGKRSVNGRLDRPKAGVFQLARECGAPLVPVYLKGLNNLFSRTHPGFRFTRLEAEILPPLALKDDPGEMMRDWFDALAPLNEEEYRGGQADG